MRAWTQDDEDMLATMTAVLRRALESGYRYVVCIDDHGSRGVLMHNLIDAETAAKMAVRLAKLELPTRSERRTAAGYKRRPSARSLPSDE